jgi:hypothetical protein
MFPIASRACFYESSRTNLPFRHFACSSHAQDTFIFEVLIIEFSLKPCLSMHLQLVPRTARPRRTLLRSDLLLHIPSLLLSGRSITRTNSTFSGPPPQEPSASHAKPPQNSSETLKTSQSLHSAAVEHQSYQSVALPTTSRIPLPPTSYDISISKKAFAFTPKLSAPSQASIILSTITRNMYQRTIHKRIG